MTSANTSLHARLRRSTRRSHRELETLLPISGPKPGPDEYEDHLRFLMSFHVPVESRLEEIDGLDRHVPGLHDRFKRELLRSDLGSRANVPFAPDEFLPDMVAVPDAMGVLYVLEGSSIGATVVRRELEQAGVLPGTLGSSYLTCYGFRTSQMWQAFIGALERRPIAEWPRIDRAARATFEALIGWRRYWGTAS